MKYARQLSKLARTFGCAVHSYRLSCPRCEPPEPLPEPLLSGLPQCVDGIVARVGIPAVKAACRQVGRPPVYDACGRCGGPRQCGTCGVNYSKRLLSAIGLTAEEEATMQAQLALGRAMDADAEKAQR